MAKLSGDILTEDEVIDNLMLLAAVVFGNVQAGLASTLAQLMKLDLLYSDEPLTPAMIEECLRLESPGHFQGRITRAPVEIAGRTIPQHSLVFLGLGSANRDPEAFPDPARYNPDRGGLPHLAFGNGAHMCMGREIVRQSLTTALERLRAAPFKLRPVSNELDWQIRPGHRWLATLNVRTELHPGGKND